jgi:uncharacterized protein (TIGR04141 family)
VVAPNLMGGFAVGRAAPEEAATDVSVADVIAQLGDVTNIADERLRERLRRLRLWAFDDQGPAYDWPITQCLEAEIPWGDQLRILDEGRWWIVNTAFREQLLADLRKVPESKLRFPEWKTGWDEGAFNVEASKGARRINLDKKNIAPKGATQVEPCDVYAAGRILVHVKRREKSSGLSHLFAQAAVVAELLADEPRALKRLRGLVGRAERLRGDLPPDVRPDQLTFALCIGAPASKCSLESLQFFSLVNLRDAVRRIKRTGCLVTLDFVEMK